MVLTAYFALSPVTGLFCHRRQRIWRITARLGECVSAKLDASVGASGPHDFAVRDPSTPKASTAFWPVPPKLWRRRKKAPFVRALVHRSRKTPPCDYVARPTLPRPPHPAPTSVTIAIRPSLGTGW